MKFFGEEIKEIDKGYFGVRRCTVCDEKLRDVNLVELQQNFNIFFIILLFLFITKVFSYIKNII